MTTIEPMQATSAVAHHATTGGAWLAALRMAADANHKLLHLHVTITDPASEDHETRFLADQMLIGERLPPVQTVVNTLFPAALARSCRGSAELVARYRRIYKRIKNESGANRKGTYFGRLICYPGRDREVDQLTRLINYLHCDYQKSHRPRAIYEMATSTSESDHDPQSSDMVARDHFIPAKATAHGNGHQSDIDHIFDIGADVDGQEMQVYAPTPDTIRMGGFPCLSHLSFQRDGQHLHLMAHYRHQLLVQRAYGNYLALGLLQGYIAAAADLHVGHLSVNAGLATLEISPSKLDRYLALLDQQRLW
jgi:hypothetical protein